MSPSADAPALRYYRSLVGRWSGEFTLADDGWRLRMAGVQRPRGAPVEPYAGDGEIAPGGDAATYAIQWAGAPMTQRTQVVAEGLRLTQETEWSRASVLLRRRP